MNTSIFRFTLDLQSVQSQISSPVTRADTARTWEISFSDGNQPFLLEDGFLAKLEIKRPTGTYLEEFCAIKERTNVLYYFSQNENTAAVEGLHDCAVILYGADGTVIGSPRFSMIVTDRVISSDDVNLSDDDKTAVEAMITAEASRQEAERLRVNAEAERVSAESARVQTMEQIGQMLDGKNFLPTVTAADEGKVLSVSGGVYALTEGEGIDVNPDEEATDVLSKIRVGGTVYALPVGGAAVAEYGGDTVIGTGNVGPIISGVSYGATEGMTWEVWLASEHNVLGLSAADPYVVSSDGRILVYALTQNPAALSDAVVIGGLYELAAPAEQTNGGGEA